MIGHCGGGGPQVFGAGLVRQNAAGIQAQINKQLFKIGKGILFIKLAQVFVIDMSQLGVTVCHSSDNT